MESRKKAGKKQGRNRGNNNEITVKKQRRNAKK